MAVVAHTAASVVGHDGAASSAREPLTALRVNGGATASLMAATRVVLAPAAADDSIGTGHSGEASLALAFGLASVGLAGEARALDASGAVDLIGLAIVGHILIF
jgi:tRNA C32,U32 (ribose-2'-O)-methylase TrmJ